MKTQHNYFFKKFVKTKGGAGRIGTARNGTAGGRPITGMADGVNRPMTGIRGAGFPGTASGSRTGGNLNFVHLKKIYVKTQKHNYFFKIFFVKSKQPLDCLIH